MAMWGVVFLVVAAGIAVSADPDGFTFPEVARGNAGSRIVSGWEAEEGQIPFQISMRMVNPIGTVNACGGSIIHSDWGLTAAHCTATRVTMVIRAGAVNLTRPEILFETTEYFNHPDYIDALVTVVQPNDIALLKFPFSLTFSDRVRPIRLQRGTDMNRSYSGVRMVASGWGLTWTQGTSPENMNWVFLSGVSNQLCFLAFGGSSIIQDSTICASGYNVTSQSTCQGDSGGPLTVIDDDNHLSQVGVASFVSSTGCHTDNPAGFIRPGHYHDWYYEVTGINFDWDPETSTTAQPEPTEVTTPEPESVEVVYPTTAAPESSESHETEEVEVVYPTTAAPESSESHESEEVEVVYPTTEDPESSEEEEVPSTTAGPEDSSEEEEVPTTTAAPDSSEEEVPETTVAPVESSQEEEVPDTTTAPVESSEEEEVPDTTAAPVESSEEEEVPDTTAAPVESSEEEEVPDTTAAPVESSEEEEVPDTTAALVESSEEEEVPDTTTAPVGSSEEEEEETEGYFGRFIHSFWRSA